MISIVPSSKDAPADTLGAWVLARDERTVYDEWNPVAQIDAAGAVVQRHLWGTDLSGTPQGAGGVGGLLGTWDNGATTRDGSGPGDGVARVWVCAYDGNGNVSAVIAATVAGGSGGPGTVRVARYDYDAFGKTLATWGDGSVAEANRYRFSTKPEDGTGLLYYGYRYLDTRLGRWVSRDPIGEEGGLNLYGFLGNQSIQQIDVLGEKVRGSGHHIIPWSIFNEKVSSEVQRFFNSDAARIFNEYFKNHNFGTVDGIKHSDYNKIVKEELDRFLGSKALREMTLREAEAFLERIKSMPPSSPIGRFNAGVAEQAATAMRVALQKAANEAAEQVVEEAGKKGGKGILAKAIGRKIPVVGIVVIIFTVSADAQAHGWGPAIGNGAVDAIPFVGVGKGIIEIGTGWSLIEELSGNAQIDPETSVCSEFD